MAPIVEGVHRKAPPPRGSMPKPPDDIVANVFISTTTLSKLPRTRVVETARVGNLATATVRLSDLKAIANEKQVRQISLAQGLRNCRQEAGTPGP